MDKILVIDDEATIRELFKKLLKRQKYKVLTASNGKKGIEITKKDKPDLIILDLKMPVVDGVETLKRIKKFNKRVIVIVLTAYGTIDAASQAMALGAHDFITKPFDITRIRVSVKKALQMQKLSDEVAKLRSKLKRDNDRGRR